jgi:hypothetical protein
VENKGRYVEPAKGRHQVVVGRQPGLLIETVLDCPCLCAPLPR